MQKIVIIITILLFCIVLYFFTKKKSPLKTTLVQIKNQTFTLEIANTVQQRVVGLSNRNSLCLNCGMIFIFGSEGIYPFWMKDTLIPLDMIWLDQKSKIVTILTALPEQNTPIFKLKQYSNTSPAKYIIELNADTAKKLDLKIGDKINLPSNL